MIDFVVPFLGVLGSYSIALGLIGFALVQMGYITNVRLPFGFGSNRQNQLEGPSTTSTRLENLEYDLEFANYAASLTEEVRVSHAKEDDFKRKIGRIASIAMEKRSSNLRSKQSHLLLVDFLGDAEYQAARERWIANAEGSARLRVIQHSHRRKLRTPESYSVGGDYWLHFIAPEKAKGIVKTIEPQWSTESDQQTKVGIETLHKAPSRLQ